LYLYTHIGGRSKNKGAERNEKLVELKSVRRTQKGQKMSNKCVHKTNGRETQKTHPRDMEKIQEKTNDAAMKVRKKEGQEGRGGV